MKNKLGFTLIELVIAIGILGVIGFVLTDIMTQSLRTENKSNMVNQIQQNGKTALDKISNEIRQAENIVCPVLPLNQTLVKTNTLVIFKQGEYTRFKFHAPSTDQNGFIGIDNLPQGSFDCSVMTAQSPTVSSLTNIDKINGVSIEQTSDTEQIFIRNKAAGYKDTISIKFRAKQAINAGTLPENTVGDNGVLFQTTVQTRGAK